MACMNTSSAALPVLAPTPELSSLTRHPVAPRASESRLYGHRPALREADVRANGVLGALIPLELERLMPRLQPVLFHAGQELYDYSTVPGHVYFLCSGVVSLSLDLEAGEGVEIGLVGREGVLGLCALMPQATAGHRATVLLPGKGFSLPACVLRDEFRCGAKLQSVLLKYMQAMLAQPAHIVFCNSRHSVEERLCRWLLAVRERANSAEMEVTHEQIAHLLGVRRSGISVAAGVLRKDGIIDSRRGRTIILDSQALQSRACNCHRALSQSSFNA